MTYSQSGNTSRRIARTRPIGFSPSSLRRSLRWPGRPGKVTVARNLTTKPVLFFALNSYLIVYQADVNPIRILALVHGRRSVKRVLKRRRL